MACPAAAAAPTPPLPPTSSWNRLSLVVRVDVCGSGIAVCPRRAWLLTNGDFGFSLADGALVKAVGRGMGAGDGQFNWGTSGRMCLTPRGTLLVADRDNHRVPEVDLDGTVTGAFVRVLGGGALISPVAVDCNDEWLVASQSDHYIAVLSMVDGRFVSRLGRGYVRVCDSVAGVRQLLRSRRTSSNPGT